MALQTNNYNHLNANGTYVITPNECGLETVKVNFADQAGTISVQEGNGNVIAAKLSLASVYKHDFDLQPLHGLIIVVAGGTAPDITVIWQ